MHLKIFVIENREQSWFFLTFVDSIQHSWNQIVAELLEWHEFKVATKSVKQPRDTPAISISLPQEPLYFRQ